MDTRIYTEVDYRRHDRALSFAEQFAGYTFITEFEHEGTESK